jgi:putative transposase
MPNESFHHAPIPAGHSRRAKVRGRRSRPLRVESKEIAFVTSRTQNSVFFLHPLMCSRLVPANRQAARVIAAKRARLDARFARLIKRANRRRPHSQSQLTLEEAKLIAENLISSALARAQELCREDGCEAPEVYAVVVMSNHVHLVVRAQGKNLARFVGYFKARVAMGINLLLGRTGSVWERRYDAQAILDDEAALGSVRYTLQNPQKAKLVRHIDEWPGFVALAGMTKSEQLASPWYDWTAWHRARCPGDLTPFQRTSELTLSKLPALEGQSDADYARDILESLDVLDPNERVLGVDRVLDTDVEGRPKQSKRARRPYAFGTLEAILNHRACYQAIAAMYELCSERYRRGEHVTEWPPGTYAPGFSVAA